MLLRVLIIGCVWPEPNSSAAGRRMLSLLTALQSNGGEIYFVSAAAKGEHSVDLAATGVHVHGIVLNCDSFDTFVAELRPDVVVFDRFLTEEQFGWRVERSYPAAVRILDSEDLHCLRHARHQALKQGRELSRQDLCGEMALREIAAIWRCDLTLVISEFEMALLQDTYGVPGDLLYYLPLLTDFSAGHTRAWRDFESRKHCVVVGNFRHAPNWDAVQYLRSELWPLIRRMLSKVECHVYGAYPPPKALQLHSDKLGFLVKGWASDADAVVGQARLSLAPLRFGAGQKGKLLAAMECGTPSVTTEIGAEGMCGEMPWSGHIVPESPEFSADFAAATVALYQDAERWTVAQQRGTELLLQRFQASDYLPGFSQCVAALAKDVTAHRLKHFNGLMLRHHTVKSHQYMSQWIAAKNGLPKGE